MLVAARLCPTSRCSTRPVRGDSGPPDTIWNRTRERDRRCIKPMATPHRNNAIADPDLVAVIDAWLSLPKPVKAGIVAMVRAAKG